MHIIHRHHSSQACWCHTYLPHDHGSAQQCCDDSDCQVDQLEGLDANHLVREYDLNISHGRLTKHL